jgi:Cu(I)/Ag(I) efflux system membrane fusion protein
MLARSGARGGQTPEADLSNPSLSTLQNLRLFGLTETQIENLAKTGKAEGSFELLSPQTGTVIERNVSDGQYVSEGSRLFTIVDLSLLWFRFDVYEQDLPWLQVGQVVEFSVPTAPGQVFSGPITFIEPVINETTRAAKVRVDVNNPVVEINGVKQRALRHQLYAEGRVRFETPARLVVSSAAVLFPGETPLAYVATGGGAYEVRELKLGRRGDREWEVLSGLDEGDDVVTTGNVLIDAQAQFVRGNSRREASVTELADASHPGGNSVADSSAAAPKASGLLPTQRKTLTEFLAAADGVSRALAADRLDQLKPHAAALPALAASLEKELGSGHAWQPLLDRVHSAAQWAEPKSLEAARESFLPFSTGVVELVQQVRSHEESFRSLKVYQCPMAPKPGLWFQLEGPLRNPYFGAEMLTCGKEVVPPPPTLAAPMKVLAKPSEPAPSHDAVPTPPAPAPVLVPTTSPPAAQMPGPKTGSELMASSPQVQPLNSRDHSAFEERMKSALADRFASRAAPQSRAAGHPVPPAGSSVKQSGSPAQPASGTQP